MTIHKEYQFKGLYLRKSDLTINPEYASYATNCDLNYSGELRKRNGLSLEATMPVGKSIIYLAVYKQKNELVAMASDGLYRKVGAGFVKIPMSTTGTIPIWTADCTSVELNGTMYISDTSGILPVFKYDGIVFTQAGNRKPIIKEDTGLIQPPYSDLDDFFGYRTYYAPPLASNDGILFAIDKQVSGRVWPFLVTPFGFEPTADIFGVDNVMGISGSSDGNILAIFRAPMNIGTGFYEPQVLIYNRTVSNLNYNLVNTINLIGLNISWQIFRSFNFVMDSTGASFVFSAYTSGLSLDTNVYTYVNNVGTWTALANLAPIQPSSGFGSAIDMQFEDPGNPTADYWLIVGAPYWTSGGSISHGQTYIYRRTGVANWTLLTTLNPPNTATPGQLIFGSTANITRIANPATATNTMQAYTTYRLPGGNPQLAIYTLNTTTNTWSAPVFITIPGNEQVDYFGYRVKLMGNLPSNRMLVVSSPMSASGIGSTTYGKVFIYSMLNDIANYVLKQTLVSPDVSANNNSNSSFQTIPMGFGGWITLTSNTPTGMVISYPAFNILDINNAGRVFGYHESQVIFGTFELDLSTSSENQKFMRFYTTYVDANGNIVNSEAVTFTFNGTKAKFTLETFGDTWYNDRYFIGDTAFIIPPTTNATPSLTIRTISHNLVAGDKVLVKTYTTVPGNLNTTYPHEFQLLTVISVTANDVTLNTSELVKDTYITNRLQYKGQTVVVPLNGSNAYWNIFVSDDEFFGYQLVASLDAQDIITDATLTITIELDDIVISEEVDIFLNDIYDDTVLKKEIPHIRYLGTYQNLLIGANIKYPEEQDKAEFRNRFIWSDASVGGSAETFAPFDYDVIGENISQELTGIIGTQDNIHIFKNRKSYAVSGLLIGGQYRVRELISEETGCVNHNSLIPVKGQVLFMSEAGVYGVAGGANPREVSDANQPLFMSPNIDLSKTIATLDGKYERVYLFLKNSTPANNILLVWNYYFDSWVIYDGIPMTGPIVTYNDRLNVANGIELKEMKDSVFMDYISPVLSSPVYFRYYTGWFHMNMPSLRKKFVNLVLFSILKLRDFAPLPFLVSAFASEPPNFSIDVKTQIDWIALDTDNFNVPFALDKRVDDHKIAITQSKSLRFLFENNRNEPVLLTGYEFEWQETQEKPKGLR